MELFFREGFREGSFFGVWDVEFAFELGRFGEDVLGFFGRSLEWTSFFKEGIDGRRKSSWIWGFRESRSWWSLENRDGDTGGRV